jgi:hypothetical protein
MKTVKKTSAKKYQRGGQGVLSTADGSTYKSSGKKKGSGIGPKAEYRDFATGDGDRVFAPAGQKVGGLKAKMELRKSNKEVAKKGNIKVNQKGGTAKPKAAYGMAVKPSMMKKGGAKKKSK